MIKELKSQPPVPVQPEVSTEEFEKIVNEKLDDKLDKLKDEFNTGFKNFKESFFEMENSKNYSVIESGISKKLDLPSAVKIIDAQTELLNNLKTEYDKSKIQFKDQTGEVIQLTQKMFEMIFHLIVS